ncbi:MAG: ABC transporter ATP-binding protein [Chloroflexi bacterium]|nr:ABC transporter ATP-binding protein [Chloroflexota bacterium]
MTTSSSATAIQFEGVNKFFGRFQAVKDLNLEIREGEFFSLLGPSGCGKTTSLRMLAGFEEADSGCILLRGSDVTSAPPNKRPVNMVFQHYELFPHMTVFGNVAYGLRLKKVRDPELSRRVQEMLRVVRVDGLEGRGARQLSGGQQQRVALARALVNRPAVLLLDEPLSALDVKLRKQMQIELKSIQHQLGTTFVYVTHDQEEALLMSDRIGIMNQGRLLQVGTPREIYGRPADAFVADFVGSLNAFDLRVDEVSGGRAVMRLADGEHVAVALEGAVAAPASTIRVAIRPERIRVTEAQAAGADTGAPGASRVGGVVTAVDYVGSLTTYRIETALGLIAAQEANDTLAPDLVVGDRVVLSWAPDAAFVLPPSIVEG